jgi:DNA replication protein DnaC
MNQYPKKFAEWLRIVTFGDPELEKVVQGCWEWTQAFSQKLPARWISLVGASGTGKTHCAERLWNWSFTRSNFGAAEYVPHKIVWPSFVQRLRAGHAYEMRDDFKRWPVLFLDDVGSERDTTGFATEELVTLLLSRMNRWTIITSNKTPEGLRAIDERIYSRMIRGQNICIGINTKDFSDR